MYILKDQILLNILKEGNPLLLEGPPGVGKTSFSKFSASVMGAEYIYFLCHSGVTEEDLFVKLDPAKVAALAAGLDIDIKTCYRPGVLLQVILKSHEGPVILCLDEIDKTHPSFDVLLLDFLEELRIQGPFGETWTGRKENIYVILTSNGQREISGPLLRRCFRYQMRYLEASEEINLILKETGASKASVSLVLNIINRLRREHPEDAPSLSEIMKFFNGVKYATSPHDIKVLIQGFLCRTPEMEVYFTKVNLHKKLWKMLRKE